VWKYKCIDCAHYFCSSHCKDLWLRADDVDEDVEDAYVDEDEEVHRMADVRQAHAAARHARVARRVRVSRLRRPRAALSTSMVGHRRRVQITASRRAAYSLLSLSGACAPEHTSGMCVCTGASIINVKNKNDNRCRLLW
jgi:hypothetical protein